MAKHNLTQQQLNDRADALNFNRGTSGNNIRNAHMHGNRGGQIQQHRLAQQPGQHPASGKAGK